MAGLVIMKKLLKKCLFLLRNFHIIDHLDRIAFYRISSVDLGHQTVLIHIIQKNIFIKQTFAQAISSPEIIEGLSCEQACWLGIYYGEAFRAALHDKGNFKNIKKPGYFLKHRHGRYRIHCENRDGTITCMHIKTKEKLTLSPLTIAKDPLFIKEFDENQACYIGILAGIQMHKNESGQGKNLTQKLIPHLRIVK